jgi:transient receptor potential cation channel subfamily M protein 6
MNIKIIIAFQIAYIAFLIMFTYTVLGEMENKPSWQELYTIIYVCTLLAEKVREIASEPVSIRYDKLWFLHLCSQF